MNDLPESTQKHNTEAVFLNPLYGFQNVKPEEVIEETLAG